jgi:predicted transcriptional regulator of viral defense system
MKLEYFFARHPVFTYEEITHFLEENGQSNPNTQRELIAYHCKTGNITRIRRQLFASVPKMLGNAKQHITDPYLIAGRISNDAVLAYHTALDFYGYSHSVYSHYFFLTHHTIRSFHYKNMYFHSLHFPKSLFKGSKEYYAVNTEDQAGLDVKVTSLERTLVDCLDKPNLAGGWEEIWQSFETPGLINLDKVLEYTFLMNKGSLAAKVGFFLEQHQGNFSVDEKYLNLLQEKIPKQKQYLERNQQSRGMFLKRWNLIVPETVLKRAWEEPNESI